MEDGRFEKDDQVDTCLTAHPRMLRFETRIGIGEHPIIVLIYHYGKLLFRPSSGKCAKRGGRKPETLWKLSGPIAQAASTDPLPFALPVENLFFGCA